MFSMDLLIAFIRCSSSLPISIDEHVDEETEHAGVDTVTVGLLEGLF